MQETEGAIAGLLGTGGLQGQGTRQTLSSRGVHGSSEVANLKQMWDDLEPGCVRYSPALQAGQGLRPCSVQSRARHQRGRARLTGASADQNLEEQAKAEVTLLEEGIRKQDAFTVCRCARLLAGTGIETKYRRFGRVRAHTPSPGDLGSCWQRDHSRSS